MDMAEVLARLDAVGANIEIVWGEGIGSEGWLRIDSDKLIGVVGALLGEIAWGHLSTITAQTHGGEIEVLYHLWLGWGLTLRVTCSGVAPHLPSVCAVAPVANWYEREVHDLYGVVFDGHPGLEPLLVPKGMAPPMLSAGVDEP